MTGRPNRIRHSVLSALSAALLLIVAAACGGGDEEPTVPATQPTPTSSTSTATAQPTSSTPATQAPDGQSGTLVAALEHVGIPLGTPALCVPECANEQYFFSIWETLLHWTADEEVGPGIAESWELAPDMSKFIWHIRPGIQFHKDWGEVTAEDVAWTTNQVNSNTNPDTVHDVSGDLSCCYGETTAVDKYTAETVITTYDSRAPGWLFSNLRDAYGISSKAVFDQHGSDGMRSIFVGTGPYEAMEWVEDDHLLLQALPSHYRKTASVQTVRIVAVPEEAARIAMFESGEALITHVTLPNVKRLEAAGGTKRLLETVIDHIGFAPNFLEKTDPKTGEPLDNPGFDPSLPWVSNPFAEGCDYNQLLTVTPEGTVCPEMENARKVRLAMGLAIDRNDLVEGLLDNLGWPACDWSISAKDPISQEDWCMPYDPDRARELMREAGYENGFTVGMWVGNEAQEQHQAIASMWQQELGITTEFKTGPFSVWQPTFVDRSLKDLVLDGEQGGMPADFAKGREAQAWFAGGIMWSGGIPFFQKIYGDMLTEPDKNKRLEMASQFAEHNRYWAWEVGIWERPTYTIYAGEEMEWNPTSESMHTQMGNYVYPLEDIALN